jgi:hypothetical protein
VDNLSKFSGRTIWIVDAHRGDGRRFIVGADEMLSAFVELEREVLTVKFYLNYKWHTVRATNHAPRQSRIP